jgi:hypothetical protein
LSKWPFSASLWCWSCFCWLGCSTCSLVLGYTVYDYGTAAGAAKEPWRVERLPEQKYISKGELGSLVRIDCMGSCWGFGFYLTGEYY